MNTALVWLLGLGTGVLLTLTWTARKRFTLQDVFSHPLQQYLDGTLSDDHIKAQAIEAAKAEGEAAAARARTELADLQAGIAVANAKLTEINGEIVKATEKAAEVIAAADKAEARLAKVKEQIAALATA
jgi:chromosome segregation ATPase